MKSAAKYSIVICGFLIVLTLLVVVGRHSSWNASGLHHTSILNKLTLFF